jgi:3-deoxy-D-manno-octulosonic-acid transferase
VQKVLARQPITERAVDGYGQSLARLRAEAALVEVRTGEDLAREVSSLLTDELRCRGVGQRARALVEKNRGALAATVEALAGLVA